MADDLAAAIFNSAKRLQVDPLDLGTAISYETAGTFDPWKAGPTTQWGQHRGLIQWGEPQQKQYGVYQGMTNADQLSSVEKYLTNAGVRPGMGLKDIYSAINAGHVGRYNASDANNGGAPGTVADKVAGMAAHRAKAEALLGGSFRPATSPEPILGADARQAGAEQQVALNPAMQLGPAVAPATQPQNSMLGTLFSGLAAGAANAPKGPTVRQDDSGATRAAAQGLAQRGRGLESQFLPNLDQILALGAKPKQPGVIG